MAIYEFRCSHCGDEFERSRSMIKAGQTTTCLTCGFPGAKPIPSRFSFRSNLSRLPLTRSDETGEPRSTSVGMEITGGSHDNVFTNVHVEGFDTGILSEDSETEFIGGVLKGNRTSVDARRSKLKIR